LVCNHFDYVAGFEHVMNPIMNVCIEFKINYD